MIVSKCFWSHVHVSSLPSYEKAAVIFLDFLRAHVGFFHGPKLIQGVSMSGKRVGSDTGQSMRFLNDRRIQIATHAMKTAESQ